MLGNKLTLFPLLLLIVGAVDSIRTFPMLSLFGSDVIIVAVLAAMIFLVPTALVAAELAAYCSDDEHNGIYHWVKKILGNTWAVLALWWQWINTVVWFPTILAFVASGILYLLNPDLIHNTYLILVVVLTTYWFLTWISCFGLTAASNFANACTVIGVVIPTILLLCAALWWINSGHPVHLTYQHLPAWHKLDTWLALASVINTYLGIELVAVHFKDINNPRRTLPQALTWAVVLIVIPMVLGSLAISVVIPAADLDLASGVLQTFTACLTAMHCPAVLPVLAILLLLGSFGSMTSWVIAPARGLAQLAGSGYLPQYWAQLNKHGMPSCLLVLQGVVVSGIALSFVLLPTINSVYWLLTIISAQLYLLMYILMFIAALVLAIRYRAPRNHIVPGGWLTLASIGVLGIGTCVLTICIGLIMPDSLNYNANISPTTYAIICALGLVSFTLPVSLLYLCKRRQRST